MCLGQARGRLPAGGAEQVEVFPVERPALIGGGSDVWVVDRSAGLVHRTALQLGPVTGERVLVLAGLTTGQEVIVKGVNSIEDGQAVGPSVVK